LAFWRAVELFSPQQVPTLEGERVWRVGEDGEVLLPWQAGHRLGGASLREGNAWQHHVYVGVYSLDRAFAELRAVLASGEEEEEWGLPRSGDSALAAFTVAGDGRVIAHTPGRIELSLPASSWLHVVGPRSGGRHWVAEEGVVLERLLLELEQYGVDFAEVFLIAPFRDVASRLAGYRRSYPGITAGTIHTTQGKEADVVILVLGGDPGRSGDKRWASQRPNLLNVAVSRARRRLYVIGNREDWGGLPYSGARRRDRGRWGGGGGVRPVAHSALPAALATLVLGSGHCAHARRPKVAASVGCLPASPGCHHRASADRFVSCSGATLGVVRHSVLSTTPTAEKPALSDEERAERRRRLAERVFSPDGLDRDTLEHIEQMTDNES
jgi:hypothetical protein